MEQSYEDDQGALHLLRVPRSQESIIRVERAQTPAHHMYQSVIDYRSILNIHQDPVSYKTVNRHVEEPGGYQPLMSSTTYFP